MHMHDSAGPSVFRTSRADHFRPCLKIGKAELNQQNSNRGNINEGGKRSSQFVISGGDSAKPFELLEEIFNQIPFFV